MDRKIIFDLGEVLIMGLVGVEKELSPLLDIPENEILPCFDGQHLHAICRGEISENTYLEQIIENYGWQISLKTLKALIRKNFHREIEGTQPILVHLANKYEVILLSDHAEEWVQYIKSIHSFWGEFRQLFFSYEIGKTKKEPEAFEMVLKEMGYYPEECWFVDDNARNIATAASVGINCLQFQNADQLKKQLVELRIW